MLGACAQTTYQVYEGRTAQIIEGQGGTKEVIDGYEIWDNGDPPRRYQVIGVATIEDFDNVFGNQRMRSAIPAEIKKAGGDAAIVQDGWSQGQSVGVGTAFNSKGQMSVATGQSFGRKQIRYKIVRYLDKTDRPAGAAVDTKPATRGGALEPCPPGPAPTPTCK